MRVVLDFQACQSASRFRGIGRGSWSLMIGMAKLMRRREHEVVCLFNATLGDNVAQLQSLLLQKISGLKFATFKTPVPCVAYDPVNDWRQMASRLLREHVIASLEPDFVHIPALLADGWDDDAVGSVGELGVYVPVSLTQHDLIPLALPDLYMPPGRFQKYYEKKLIGVRKAELLLAISDYSGQEASKLLSLPENKIVNISSAAAEHFTHSDNVGPGKMDTLKKFGLVPGFLFYVPGGFDPRKNIERLLKAFSSLPNEIRKRHPLVVGSKLEPGRREALEIIARNLGLKVNEFILTDYVSDADLVHLYASCHAYVFPSLHEGFGLPVLEAMACGAAVIASNCTGIPEVVGLDEALFDPYCEISIEKKICQVIEDKDFHARLRSHAGMQSRKFSWAHSAELAVNAIEASHARLLDFGWTLASKESLPSCEEMLVMLNKLDLGIGPSESDISAFWNCYCDNMKGLEH